MKKILIGYISKNWKRYFKFNKSGYVEDDGAGALILCNKLAYNDDIKVSITIKELPKRR